MGRALIVTRITAGLALGMLAGLSSPVAAQTREGFYFGIGGGAGSAQFSCEGCSAEDRQTGGSGYLKAGWTLNPHLLVGGELNVWARRDEAFDVERWSYRYNLSATATVYPSAASGFFVKGGGGLSYFDMDADFGDDTVDIELGDGPGVVVGAGYDIRLGRVALTPAVNYWVGWLDNLETRGVPYETGRRQQVLDITIGITFP
jgi:hypothetical protein